MSDPVEAAAPGTFEYEGKDKKVESKPAEESTKSFEEQVNEAVSTGKVGDDGNLILPEDLSPEVKFAATLEKRRRDTQSAYEKNRQELAVSKVTEEKLRKRLTEKVQVNLSAEEKETLDDLKNSDPEEWRNKMNEHEQRASVELQEELKADTLEASQGTELERRSEVLAKFTEDNPGLVLNDEVMENDIPPRITKKLESGDVSFEDFLLEVKDFLTAGKAIKKDNENFDEPDLSKIGGSSNADQAVDEDITTSYKDEVF